MPIFLYQHLCVDIISHISSNLHADCILTMHVEYIGKSGTQIHDMYGTEV